MNDDLSQLPARNPKSGDIHVIIDTPKGHRNKLKYDDQKKVFKLSGVLPVGSSFPYDFGFVPSTKGEDGDPIDVLVLLDEPVSVGCLIEARLIGVIEAEQGENGETFRNDRLLAVASVSEDYSEVRSLKDLNQHLLKEIEHFFISYNQVRGREFKPTGRFGPQRALAVLERASNGKPQEKHKRRA